jgi:hypothetical protein
MLTFICAILVLDFFSCRKNGKDREGAFQVAGLDTTAHMFQEYTYKKITPCDVCLQVLRGAFTFLLLHNNLVPNALICRRLGKYAWIFTLAEFMLIFLFRMP